jgi:hypothetical protein
LKPITTWAKLVTPAVKKYTLNSLHESRHVPSILAYVCKKKKGKAVPLHAMEAIGGRGGIAPKNSMSPNITLVYNSVRSKCY